MSNKPDEYTYELTSKQVRRYKVNSLGSVRWAITANLQEYLSYQGVKEDVWKFWSYVPDLFIGIVGGIIIYQWIQDTSASWTFWEIALFYALFVFKAWWSTMFYMGEAIFEGTGRVDVSENTTRAAIALGSTGKKIRVLLDCTESDSSIVLKMQVLNSQGIFPRHFPVLCGVEQRISWGRYFSEQGFFYPPNFKRDVDQLLEKLIKRYLR